MTTDASLPPPPWQRRRGPPRRRLSTDTVVAAALEILSAEGLEAVTMRRVAQALGTGPASLYAHVADKTELHELMLDEVMGEVTLPEPDPARWREQLTDLYLEVGALMAARPGLARVALETVIPTTPRVILVMEATFALMRAGGLPDAVVLAGADALALYGSAAGYEAGLRSEAATREQAADRLGRIVRYVGALPPDRLPAFHALLPAMSGTAHDQDYDSYRFGLRLLIDGLAAHAVR